MGSDYKPASHSNVRFTVIHEFHSCLNSRKNEFTEQLKRDQSFDEANCQLISAISHLLNEVLLMRISLNDLDRVLSDGASESENG